MRTLAGIVLAAGSSSRLGQAKQLVEYGGKPLAARSASLALTVCGAGLCVVTGAEHERVAEALEQLSVRIAYNPRWREGIGASLRHGIGLVDASASACLIMLVDQPLIQTEDLNRLVAAYQARPTSIAAAQYATTLGVPAVFPRALFSELAALRGDRGAGPIIASANAPTAVAMPSAEFDVDTPEALAELGRSARSAS